MYEENRLVHSVEVTDDKIHVIHLKSVFDASTVEEFEQVLAYLVSQNFFKFIIDLSRVEFISSAGWGNFTGELKRTRVNGGDIKLVGMQPEVYDVFLLLELDMFIQAFNSIDEALLAFGSVIASTEATAETPQPDSNGQGMESTATEEDYREPAAIAESPRDDAQPPIAPVEAKDQTGRQSFAGDADLQQSADALKMVEFEDAWPADEQEIPLREKFEIKENGSFLSSKAAEIFARSEEDDVEDFFPTASPDYRADASTGVGDTSDDDESSDDAAKAGDTRELAASDLSKDPLLEKIISVVIAYPAYGPSLIRKMLINMQLADEGLSRSTIYRKLAEVQMNTRAKRLAFAHENSL